MRVSSVQLNANSPSFNGVVSVRNLAARATRVYKTTPEQDRNLLAIYAKIHHPASIEAGIANIRQYLSELYNFTKDEFLNKLPAVVKEDISEVELSSKSSYATYQGGATYSELKTDGFEVTHDLTL